LLPLIKTAHLRRFLIKENKEYLIYTTPDTDIDEYPNIKKHLLSFKDKLEERYDIKNSSYPWFSIANLRNRELFEKESYKLLWPMVSPYNRFAIKDKNKNLAFTGDIYYGVPKDDFEDQTNNIYYLAGLTNSKLLEFYHQKTAKATNWGYSYGATYVSAYPIIRFSLSTSISGEIIKYKHLRDIIKKKILSLIKNKDILVLEIGGTIGDEESLNIYNALIKIESENIKIKPILISPYFIKGEEKLELSFRSKMARKSFDEASKLGLIPHFIFLRSKKIFKNDLEYISSDCDLDKEKIFLDPNGFNKFTRLTHLASAYLILCIF